MVLRYPRDPEQATGPDRILILCLSQTGQVSDELCRAPSRCSEAAQAVYEDGRPAPLSQPSVLPLRRGPELSGETIPGKGLWGH